MEESTLGCYLIHVPRMTWPWPMNFTDGLIEPKGMVSM